MLQSADHCFRVPFPTKHPEGKLFGVDACASWRFFALVQMPALQFTELPLAHSRLLETVAESRQTATVEAITAKDVRDALHRFYRDPWCFEEKKRWLRKDLVIPKPKKVSVEDDEEEDPVLALLDEAADHFCTLLVNVDIQGPCRNVNALATCVLYYFKTLHKKPN